MSIPIYAGAYHILGRTFSTLRLVVASAASGAATFLTDEATNGGGTAAVAFLNPYLVLLIS